MNFDDIQKKRSEIRNNILKGFGVSMLEEDFEKAHKDGDLHPNGKWVWVSSAAGGKGDWRTLNGRTHKKHTAANAGSAGSSSSANAVGNSSNAGSGSTDGGGVAAGKTNGGKVGNNSVATTAGKSTVTKKTDGKSTATTIEDALKQTTINKVEITSRAQKEADLRYGRDDAENNKWKTDNAKNRLKNALQSGDATKILDAANDYASAKIYEDEYNKALRTKRKERKSFIESAGRDFTDNQVEEYIDKYITEKEPSAIVNNTWHYSMGRIGSTSATITVGKGKEKSLDNLPSWRPIGVIRYSVRNYYSGGYTDVTIPVQSWDDIKKNLSDTESFTLQLYKHPKQ